MCGRLSGMDDMYIMPASKPLRTKQRGPAATRYRVPPDCNVTISSIILLEFHYPLGVGSRPHKHIANNAWIDQSCMLASASWQFIAAMQSTSSQVTSFDDEAWHFIEQDHSRTSNQMQTFSTRVSTTRSPETQRVHSHASSGDGDLGVFARAGNNCMHALICAA